MRPAAIARRRGGSHGGKGKGTGEGGENPGQSGHATHNFSLRWRYSAALAGAASPCGMMPGAKAGDGPFAAREGPDGDRAG